MIMAKIFLKQPTIMFTSLKNTTKVKFEYEKDVLNPFKVAILNNSFMSQADINTIGNCVNISEFVQVT